MCGVIGLRCEKDRGDLGALASRLLRMLEYRGYDSTGAAIQSEDGTLVLRKDVGSPTVVCERLGIGKLSGQVFCGQVRWATFGAVTRENAQPHEVDCLTRLYGAHNGNITNYDRLKAWLARRGHRLASDNDGEVLVHLVEHFFAEALGRSRDRGEALKSAIVAASRMTVGSFAAVVADPETRQLAAIKAGSSLYMGFGHDEARGSFMIASSDLASVLSRTKLLLPLREDEFVLYTHDKARFYDLRSGRALKKKPVRSRLNVEETELKAPFKYFMQQEIFGQPAAVRKVIRLFLGRSERLALARTLARKEPRLFQRARAALRRLSAVTHAAGLGGGVLAFARSKDFGRLRRLAASGRGALKTAGFESSMGTFLEELARLAPADCLPGLKLLDGACLRDDVEDVAARTGRFARLLLKAHEAGGSVYLAACGTSYHAAKVAAVFFNKIAGIKVFATLPGDFRAEALSALRDGDLFVAVSQSGETKDLVDVIDLIRAARKRVSVVTVVNNVNSTLALEKTDLCIPLLCGPEIAVPATKSFMNQLAVFYILALEAASGTSGPNARKKRLENLLRVPELIEETLTSARGDVDRAARKLFMKPSIHVLATGMQGVAKEGALKIREVVLNHTEGYEASEFKHGPNTILGVNTVFGIEALRSILGKFAQAAGDAAAKGRLSARGLARLYRAVADYAFDDVKPRGLSPAERRLFEDVFARHNFFESLYTNYPLVFVTGPSERDVNLTVSQINTHKIRGADMTLIAEDNRALREALGKAQPARYGKRYESGYIRLPATGDDLLPFFTATAALQLLALRMSVRKLALLDRLEIKDHGVHPDSPKNVSKSITVD